MAPEICYPLQKSYCSPPIAVRRSWIDNKNDEALLPGSRVEVTVMKSLPEDEDTVELLDGKKVLELVEFDPTVDPCGRYMGGMVPFIQQQVTHG